MRRNRPTVLVTAGPTRAYFDRVRYLTNLSTGELGMEICRALSKAGCDVVAVVGPSPLPFEELRIKKLVRVETTGEMRDAVLAAGRKYHPDVAIFSAAVLDFEPRTAKGKVSSHKKSWVVKLRPTPKIIDEAGKKFPAMKRIGFKLEATKRSEKFCRDYIRRKKLHGLVYNWVEEIEGHGHRALWVPAQGEPRKLRSKKAIASALTSIARKLTSSP